MGSSAGSPVRLWANSSVAALPLQVIYDFVYLGVRAAPQIGISCQEELDAEVRETFARLRPGGILAVPVDDCGGLAASGKGRCNPPEPADLPQILWRQTRTAGPSELD